MNSRDEKGDTGLIVAMAQSRPEMGSSSKKGETYWNLATDPSMGGIQGYQQVAAANAMMVNAMTCLLHDTSPITSQNGMAVSTTD